MKDGAEWMVTALAVAAIFAGSVQAAAQDQVSAPGWKQALRMRSEGLNRLHQLGDFAPSWNRALHVRSEALNRR
jgi:hypothetical protein